MIAFGANAAMAADEASASPVVKENRFADSSTFSSDYAVQAISSVVQGYARQTSVNIGEPIDLVVSGPNRWLPPAGEEPAEAVDVELYRLGYYDGKGARLVWKTPKPVSTWQRFNEAGEPANEWEGGNEPAVAPVEEETGLTGRANNKITLTIPGTAAPASGVYLAKLKSKWLDFPPGVPAVERTGESHIVFIVRDDARPRDVLAVLPTNTWQAYNYWGGRSTYTYNSRYGNSGSIVPATGTERAAKVSWDRPYNNWIGDYNWVLRTEFPAIWWMEQQGYDVAYTDDLSLHFDPDQALAPKTKSLAILGHGEYWTKGIRDAVEEARDSGVSIYNFGANTGYWRVRYETVDGRPAANAAEARVLVCYKTIEGGGTTQPTIASKADPVEPTTTWRDPGNGPGQTPGTTAALPAKYTGNRRPERTLFGVQYIGDDDSTNRGLTIPAANGAGEFAGHRAWRNTTVPKSGTTLGTDLVGWEWDGVPAAGQPYNGVAPEVKYGTKLQRLSETDPRLNQPSGAEAVYVLDAGRSYGGRGATAMPPTGGNPYSHAVTYTAPSGALVFSAGTIHWSWGLGPHHLHRNTDTYSSPVVDSSLPQIRQATANLFYDGGIVPATPSGVIISGDGTTPDGTTPGGTTPGGTTPGGTTPGGTTPGGTTPGGTTPGGTTPGGTTPGGTTPGGTTPTTPVDKTPPVVTLGVLNGKSFLLNAFKISSNRVLAVRLACSSSEKSGPVRVDVKLLYGSSEFATGTAQVLPGKSVDLNLVITTTGYKKIQQQLLFLSTIVRVTATDAAGNAATTNTNARLY